MILDTIIVDGIPHRIWEVDDTHVKYFAKCVIDIIGHEHAKKITLWDDVATIHTIGTIPFDKVLALEECGFNLKEITHTTEYTGIVVKI